MSGGPGLPGGPEEPGPADRPDDAPLTEADVERMLQALDGDAGAAPAPAADAPDAPGRLALVLTPVASAPALAGLCAMSGIDVGVLPSASGAVATLEVPAPAAAADWDVSELLGGDEGGFPPQAEELAATLSRLARAGVVLVVADLATDVGIESGLSGHVSARRYVAGEPAGDVPAGLLVASADQVVEDLILGRTRPADVRGFQRAADLPRWKAARMFGRGLRRRKP
ncbi:hypothetical protein MF406_07230 [Georgenia sp. TF02-10]|uniref:hypothetical protein n=1 Tax=Georgenia sp. TF02-10 TaxID=2917725 RepID=UPI001FA78F80|nr:hypothetical protein [Georgenia sp. TF02-10]UNX56003.1 hypothetical protein MF406_07230 [Georgenia sp. TF02-10]